jgi:tryptophan synthase alpha chain
MNRIDLKFRELKKKGRKAFIAFITAGYPDLSTTARLILELEKSGADIIELGIPFSDPMADGPVIQEASMAALKKKADLRSIFKMVKSIRLKTEIPLCFMTYYNPVFCFGIDNFVRQAKACGVDGVIIPDLPPEEAADLIKAARTTGLATVFFISPTTADKRMRNICDSSQGFIYYVCLTGVTGARRELPRDLPGHIKKIKLFTKKPVCVGFGVSTPGQVKQAQSQADGVIVGSAIIKKIKENAGKKDLVSKVGKFVRNLKG